MVFRVRFGRRRDASVVSDCPSGRLGGGVAELIVQGWDSKGSVKTNP